MRGFFGIGVECVSKSMNVGSLFALAHALARASSSVDAQYDRGVAASYDTSGTPDHVPFYSFPDVESLVLPARCELVGIELVPDSWELSQLPSSEPGSLCLRTRAGQPVSRDSGTLRLHCSNSDEVLRQCRHCRRHSHV